jgi:hypothetical protein
MSKQKNKFTPLSIGTYVSFNQSVRTTYKRGNVKDLLHIFHYPSLEGFIVGGSYICLGEVIEDKKNSWCTGFRDRLIVKKKVFVYLVKIGYTNKPFMVLPKNVDTSNLTEGYLYNDHILATCPKIPFLYKREWGDI